MPRTFLAVLTLFLAAAALPRPASAATAEAIARFQADERQKRAELETRLRQREKDNQLAQQAAVRKFRDARLAATAAADTDLAGLPLNAKSARIDALRSRLAAIAGEERDTMKPFEDERQRIRDERAQFQKEFTRKVVELNNS